MSRAAEILRVAMERAMALRPVVGGFPYLAESLRQAGVTRNIWSLPSCQSVYETIHGNLVMTQTPLVTGMVEIPPFDKVALITALRRDQMGETTFPEFLSASWNAGVTSYTVDFNARKVSYYGIAVEDIYEEEYSQVPL